MSEASWTDRGATRWSPLARNSARALKAIPNGAIVRVSDDLFAPGVRDATRSRTWDAMWASPKVTFLVETRRLRALFDWTREHASVRSFGWGYGMAPMECGEVIDLDTLFYRNRCGWADGRAPVNNGYGCAHPKAKDSSEPGACFSWVCPIAEDVGGCIHCGKDEEDCTCERGFESSEENPRMELHERPRDAMAANVWVGTTLRHGDNAGELVHLLRMAPAWRRFVRLVGDVAPPRGMRGSHEPWDIHWTVRRGVWTATRRRLPIAKGAA